MKFIVNSQLFVKQLQAISGVLTTNNALPIISCFHLHLDEGKLTVKATDMNTTLETTITDIETNTAGLTDIAVPSKLLLDILKSLDDVPMTFSVDDKNYGIEIVSGQGKYRLAGMNPENYPEMPVAKDTQKVVMPASLLVNAISKTSFAASTEELRPQMSGIYCELTPDGATFVATDAQKLVRYRRSDIKADESTNFILPSKPMSMIKNIINSRKEDCEALIEYNNTNLFVTIGNYYVICRLIDGKYPNYEAAIPKDNPNRLTIDRLTLMNTLKRVGLFANQSTNQVRLSLSSQELVISAEDIEFANDANEKLACSYEGKEMEIGFSAKFLVEMLNNLDTDEVMIEMSDPRRAGIIFPVSDDQEGSAESILMLVMPMLLAN